MNYPPEDPTVRQAAPVEVRAGRRGPAYADVYEWVALSGVHPIAAFLYQILKMHVNRKRGDAKCWPTMDTLATMCGLSRGDKLNRYMAMLIDIKAVDKVRAGLPARNIYTVHDLPPEGYTGPICLADWYTATKDQVNADTPAGGELENPARPVPPSRGELAHPHSGDPAHPHGGDEPDEPNQTKKPDEKNPPLPPRTSLTTARKPDATRSAPAASEPAPAATGRGEDSSKNPTGGTALDAIVAEIQAAQPAWSRDAIVATLEDARTGAGRTPEVIVTAMRLMLSGRYGASRSPRRLLELQPWWEDAEDALAAQRAAEARERRAAAPRCRTHPAEPADDCGGCRIDARVAALEAAQAAAAGRGRGAGPAAPPEGYRQARAALAGRSRPGPQGLGDMLGAA